MAQSRVRGVTRWFNSTKGYGFIKVEDEDVDVFIHFSNINMDGYKTLDEGDEVEFDVENVQKGPQALNLDIITKVKKV